MAELLVNQNHFVFPLCNNMANVCVYGVAIAAGVLANRGH